MKSLVVHEYDTIISNIEYIDSTKYKYLEKKYFDELVAFVKEFTSAESDSDTTDFLKIGYKKGVKDTVSINNYVGLIELPSGYQIEVLPKVEFKGEDNENRTRTVFLKMLKTLKDFEGKAFTSAALKADRMNLYEVFINMYIKEAQTLVKHGIKSSYNTVEDNLKFYKGKLRVSDHIKANLTHKERFYVEYDEYTVDRSENRLVKSTLLKLIKLSKNDENIRAIRQLLPSFELVSESTNYDKDFSCVKIDRNTKDYEMLMKWSKVFLYNKSFTTFAGNTSSIALLFPMEKIFEEYVAKWMKRIWGEYGWDISAQDKGFHLFDTPRRFSLRPDIVARNKENLIIMDTKWKRLYPDVNNYGISQADMYQMYVYSQKYSKNTADKPDVWLLYPLTEMSSNIGNPEFTSNDGVNVHIYFVDVDNIEVSLKDLLLKVENNAESKKFTA